MADLQYSVGVNTDPAVAALSRFNNGVGALEGGLRQLGSGGSIGRLGGSLAALGGAAGFGALIARGFRFNQTIGDSQAAIAQVLAQFQGLNAEASKDAAAKAMQRIVELEPQTAGTLADLTGGFLATLAASQSAGISVEDNIDLVGKFANALANANIPAEQLAQEMRSILTGNIGADSSLAKVLGLTNEDVKRAAAAGNLYQFLVDKIGKLGSAGDTAGVAFSTLQSAVDKAAGALASGLFDDAVTGAKELSVYIEQNRSAFEALGGAIGTVSKLAGNTAVGVGKWLTLGGAAQDAFADILSGVPVLEAIDNAFLDVEQRVNGADVAFKRVGDTAATALTPAVTAADKLAAALAAVDAQAKGTQTQPAAPGGGGGGGESEPSEGGRKKIMGYSAERQGGRDAARARANARMEAARARIDKSRTDNFGGINEFNALQSVQLSGDNEGQRAFSAFGGDSGRISAAEAGRRVGAFREGGATPGDSAAFGRIQDALAPATPAPGQAAAAPLTSPEMIERLDAVIAELKLMNQ
jgi:hypothetical protein